PWLFLGGGAVLVLFAGLTILSGAVSAPGKRIEVGVLASNNLPERQPQISQQDPSNTLPFFRNEQELDSYLQALIARIATDPQDAGFEMGNAILLIKRMAGRLGTTAAAEKEEAFVRRVKALIARRAAPDHEGKNP